MSSDEDLGNRTEYSGFCKELMKPMSSLAAVLWEPQFKVLPLLSSLRLGQQGMAVHHGEGKTLIEEKV